MRSVANLIPHASFSPLSPMCLLWATKGVHWTVTVSTTMSPFGNYTNSWFCAFFLPALCDRLCFHSLSMNKGVFHGTWWCHQMEHFPRYWPFMRGIHRSPVNSLHKGQWRGALMFSLICARINGWVNNGEAGDLRRNHVHYDVTVMRQKDRWSVTQKQVYLGLGDHPASSPFF